MTRNVEKYCDHASLLARKMKCELRQVLAVHGMMYVEFGYVEAPVICTQRDYFINLHELGHYALGHTQGRPPKGDKRHYFDNGVLRSEAEAWEWALDNAIDKPDIETRQFCWSQCLGSYYRYAQVVGDKPTRLSNGNRHHVEFVFDKPDDYFFKVVNRLTEGLDVPAL